MFWLLKYQLLFYCAIAPHLFITCPPVFVFFRFHYTDYISRFKRKTEQQACYHSCLFCFQLSKHEYKRKNWAFMGVLQTVRRVGSFLLLSRLILIYCYHCHYSLPLIPCRWPGVVWNKCDVESVLKGNLADSCTQIWQLCLKVTCRCDCVCIHIIFFMTRE